MRQVIFLLVISFVGLVGQGQTITVRNFLNADAPVARESLTLIEGQNFTNEEIINLDDPLPTTSGGVTVRVGGVPQRIFSVSSTRVVILMDAAGLAVRDLQLQTKSGELRQANVSVATVWPGVVVRNAGDGADSFYISGRWTVNGIDLPAVTSEPIPVGPPNRPTFVLIQGSGWSFVGPTGITVRLNGVPCRVIASRRSTFPNSQDELLFQIPSYLAGSGVMDLTVTINGRQSNYARINLGNAAAVR